MKFLLYGCFAAPFDSSAAATATATANAITSNNDWAARQVAAAQAGYYADLAAAAAGTFDIMASIRNYDNAAAAADMGNYHYPTANDFDDEDEDDDEDEADGVGRCRLTPDWTQVDPRFAPG